MEWIVNYRYVAGFFGSLSTVRKIRAAIVDILLDVAERYSIDETLLLTDYINGNPTGQMLIKLQPYAQIS